MAPITVYWNPAWLGAEYPLFASLEPCGPVFASIQRIEVPRRGWQACIRHRGWEHRLEAWFSTIPAAQRAVERWAAAHEGAIREALKSMTKS